MSKLGCKRSPECGKCAACKHNSEVQKLKRRIAELEVQLPKWVNASKTPPDKKQHLLIKFKSGIVASCKWRYGSLGEPVQDTCAWRCDCSGRFANPEYWMPLPQPPKEKDHELFK